MKKLLLILLLLPAWVMAQQAQPVSPVQVPQTTLYNEPSTGTRWWYNGATLGWYPLYPYTPPNTVLTGLSLTVVGSTLTVHTGTWRINNAVYTLGTPANFTLQARDSVYSRYETVYATKVNNGIGIKVGVLSPTPIQPSVGTDTLIVGAVLITPTSTIIIPPGPSNQFVFSIPGVQQSYANPWVRTLRVDTVTIGGHYILPPIDGTSGQTIQTDGAGNLFWSNQAIYLPSAPITLTGNHFGIDTTVVSTIVGMLDTLKKNAAHFNPTQFSIVNDTINCIACGGSGSSTTIYTKDSTLNSDRTLIGNGHSLEFYMQHHLGGSDLLIDSLRGVYISAIASTSSTGGVSTMGIDSAQAQLTHSGSTNAGSLVIDNNNTELLYTKVSGGAIAGLQMGADYPSIRFTDQINHRGITEDSTTVNENGYTNYNYITRRFADSTYNIGFTNGLTKVGSTGYLGGALTQATEIDATGFTFDVAQIVSASSYNKLILSGNTNAQIQARSTSNTFALNSVDKNSGQPFATIKTSLSGVEKSISLQTNLPGIVLNDAISQIGGKYLNDYSTNQRLNQLSIPSVKTVILLADSVKGTISGGGTTTNPLTMNNSGSGAASGSTFDGSSAKTISYNTIGAAPLASPTFTGTVTIPNGGVFGTPTSLTLTNATGLPNAGLVNSTISGVALGSNLATLTATNATLTFSGSYTGASATTVGLNLSSNNNWIGVVTASNNFETSGATSNFYAAVATKGGFWMNSSGSHYFVMQNASSTTGMLGYATGHTGSLGTSVLTWSDGGNVSVVNGNLTLGTAGNGLFITEGTNGRVGQTTLVSGTKAITVTGVTTSSRAIVTLVSQGGTVTTTTAYAAVCTSNTLTITALTNAGTTDTTDTSVLNYMIIN